MNIGKKYQDLILRSFTGELSEEEKLSLQAWTEEAKDHKRYYEEMIFLWHTSQVYQKSDDRERKRDWDNISKRLHIKSKEAVAPEDKRKSGKKIFDILKIAAVFLGAFALSWYVYHYFSAEADKKEASFYKVITKKGQKAKVILPDNTVIWLNAESRLEYPVSFNNKNRKVILSGEAFFKVQKTSDHDPFMVETSGLDIRVTGTSFNVKAYPDEDIVETTLIEGSVTLLRKIGNSYQTIQLKPDQKATLLKRGANIRIDDVNSDKPSLPLMSPVIHPAPISKEKIIISPDVNIESHVAWKNDRLVFENESFEEIAYQLERWFDVQIIFKDDALKKYCYTGKFIHKESLEEILKVIRLTTPFHYKIDKNRVIIYKLVLKPEYPFY